MNIIDRFSGGSDGVRDKLNQLVDAVNMLMRIRGDESFIAVNNTGPLGGITVALNIGRVMERVPRLLNQGTFPVLVRKDGGDAGGLSAKCTFTYSVYDLSGTLMKKDANDTDASHMSPEFDMRGTVGLMVAPEDDSYGLAFYDVDNDGNRILVLYMTNEQPATNTGNCSG